MFTSLVIEYVYKNKVYFILLAKVIYQEVGETRIQQTQIFTLEFRHIYSAIQYPIARFMNENCIINNLMLQSWQEL